MVFAGLFEVIETLMVELQLYSNSYAGEFHISRICAIRSIQIRMRSLRFVKQCSEYGLFF